MKSLVELCGWHAEEHWRNCKNCVVDDVQPWSWEKRFDEDFGNEIHDAILEYARSEGYVRERKYAADFVKSIKIGINNLLERQERNWHFSLMHLKKEDRKNVLATKEGMELL